MPDRHVKPYHIACKFAPWSGTVYNIVKFIGLSFICLKTFDFVVLYQNFRYFYTSLNGSAILLHFLCISIGDHRSVKISIVLCIACSQDVFCRNVRQDFFNTVFISNILSIVPCSLCKCDTGLDRSLYLLVGCYYQCSCLVESCSILFLLLPFSDKTQNHKVLRPSICSQSNRQTDIQFLLISL